MKKFTPTPFTFILSLIILLGNLVGFSTPPQWTSLTTGTTEKLRDVNFLNPDYGIVVGDNATVLLTNDGGQTWSGINAHAFSGNVYSGLVLNYDTFVVCTFDQINFTGATYLTNDAGNTWTQIGTEPGTAHPTQLGSSDHQNIYSVGGNLLRSTNSGTSWDTLLQYTGGINSLYQIQFQDQQTGVAGGLNSGFATYSANFARTTNGTNWYLADVFSFPNADAYTTLDFPALDTGYMFVNHYNGFVPSNQNALWKLYNFTLSVPFPGDSLVQFSSQIVNANTPGYAFAADFQSTQNGYAVFTGGTIYKTADGGVNWNLDFTSTADTLSDIQIFEESTGYAVGDDGTVLKLAQSTAVPSLQKEVSYRLFPNPASDKLILNLHSNENSLSYSIISLDGKICLSGKLQGKNTNIDISDLTAGVYSFELLNPEGKLLSQSKLMKQ